MDAFSKGHLQDINPLKTGQVHGTPGLKQHIFCPDFCMLGYVLQGEGIITRNNSIFPVTAGQTFLIPPGKETVCTAATGNPWHYWWVSFTGTLSNDFSLLPPVVDLPGWLLRPILRPDRDNSVAEYQLTGVLFQVYAHLFSGSPAENQYVRQVEDYIHNNFMNPIRVEQLAQQLNLNRRYISRLFKEKTGLSIQAYLIEVRMEAAEQFLRKGYSVKETASMCGYEDASTFSRMFKLHTGKTPSSLK